MTLFRMIMALLSQYFLNWVSAAWDNNFIINVMDIGVLRKILHHTAFHYLIMSIIEIFCMIWGDSLQLPQ